MKHFKQDYDDRCIIKLFKENDVNTLIHWIENIQYCNISIYAMCCCFVTAYEQKEYDKVQLILSEYEYIFEIGNSNEILNKVVEYRKIFLRILKLKKLCNL